MDINGLRVIIKSDCQSTVLLFWKWKTIISINKTSRSALGMEM